MAGVFNMQYVGEGRSLSLSTERTHCGKYKCGGVAFSNLKSAKMF